MEDHDLPIPDTSCWQPRNDAAARLGIAFLKKCRAIEERIRLRAQQEREMNIDNFDSGLGVEDIVRGEISQLLPTRYNTLCGVVNDSNGLTGGDHDIVIFNSEWMPNVKDGATATSRRVHFPIEGVYAVGEVKQTLSYATLDAAMEKLVTTHRLHRPPTHAGRIVENRELHACKGGLTNPLFSFILAVNLAKNIRLDDIVLRFAAINRSLRRLEMVRALTVLGEGTIHWIYLDETDQVQLALFMSDDLHSPIRIGLERADEVGSAMYPLIRVLMTHLYHSTLAPEDIAAKYGPGPTKIQYADMEELIHDTDIIFAEEITKRNLPYDCTFDPFSCAKVDKLLGAHVDEEGD